MSVMEQIRELEAQKAKLLEDAKAAAVKKADEAIAELAELGFNYKLVEGGSSTPSTGRRRTGVRQDVLNLVTEKGTITRADVLMLMDAKGDKSAEQSISNALANLKKAGKLVLEDGMYKATGE